MPGEKHGEFIELRDDCGGSLNDELYVMGHLSDEDYETVLRERWLDYEGEEPPEHGPIRHAYGEWSERDPEGEGCRPDDGWLWFYEHAEDGPGRFPVTAATEAEWYARCERSREAKAAARRRVLELYPGVEVLGAYSSGDDPPTASVRFQLPGSSGRRGVVQWHSDDPDHVWVAPIDRDAWESFCDQLDGGGRG